MRSKSYWRFLFHKDQSGDWLFVLSCTLAACLVMVYFYPYPTFITDSFDYIMVARSQTFWPIRPYGYPVFLSHLHQLSGSIWSIIVSQGLLYALSLTLLLLAIKKYWPPRRKWAFRVLEAFTVLSPTAIFLLNCVLSDALFCCMIFIMLAMGIVMVKERSWSAMLVYLAVFYAALWVRRSAEFFPLAFLPVFLLNGKPAFRISSAVVTAVLVGVFFFQISNRMEKSTGYRQASTGFDGWQLANNAIHVLPYIPSPEEDGLPDDEDVAFMHKYLYKQFDGYITRATDDGKYVSADFMWDDNAPLMKMLEYCVKGYELPRLQVWVDIGTHALKDYALWLILKHPLPFFRYYIWPNIKNAFHPFNMEAVFFPLNVVENKETNKEVVRWYSFPKDAKIQPRSQALAKICEPLCPWMEVFTWLVFFVGLFLLLIFGKNLTRENFMSLLLIFLFGLVYYGTTVFASPVAIRYWMPMHAVKLVFAWMAFRSTLGDNLKPAEDLFK